jgi:hypothetical protein
MRIKIDFSFIEEVFSQSDFVSDYSRKIFPYKTPSRVKINQYQELGLNGINGKFVDCNFEYDLFEGIRNNTIDNLTMEISDTVYSLYKDILRRGNYIYLEDKLEKYNIFSLHINSILIL